MANQLVYSRGARRGAAPSVNEWTPPQSAAAISQQALMQLMRQPQQAQRQAPQQMQDPNASRQLMPGNKSAQVSPEMLAWMLRQQQQQVRTPVDEQQATGNTGGYEGVDPSSVNTPEGVQRMAKLGFQLGLGYLGLGIPGAIIGSIASNPNSPTGPMVGGVMNAVKQAVPGLGAVEMMAQMFGADPISKAITKQTDPMARDLIDQSAAAPAPAAEAAPTALQADDFVTQLAFQRYLDRVNAERDGGGDWGGSWGGTNNSAGGSTSNGEGDGPGGSFSGFGGGLARA